ncbi:MAG: CopG family transcriptional regulator [Deltaproteobacteria bacterium]|nr:CopG family transcriptional regulator [Deltaproteobacteria bacterium]
MKKISTYTKAPRRIAREIETSVPADDFLPSPEEIALMIQGGKTIPVTMKLKKKTVEQYKMYALKMGIKYQTFVSAILDRYARHLHS